jgi:hypothetical protein
MKQLRAEVSIRWQQHKIAIGNSADSYSRVATKMAIMLYGALRNLPIFPTIQGHRHQKCLCSAAASPRQREAKKIC